VRRAALPKTCEPSRNRTRELSSGACCSTSSLRI